MWPFVLTGCLLSGLFRPVSREESYLLVNQRPANISLANFLRGRLLASFVKKGMTGDEVEKIMGWSSLGGGTLSNQFAFYSPVGVTVWYRLEFFKVAGEEKQDCRYVVRIVQPPPLLDFLPRLWPTHRAGELAR